MYLIHSNTGKASRNSQIEMKDNMHRHRRMYAALLELQFGVEFLKKKGRKIAVWNPKSLKRKENDCTGSLQK